MRTRRVLYWQSVRALNITVDGGCFNAENMRHRWRALQLEHHYQRPLVYWTQVARCRPHRRITTALENAAQWH